MDFDLTMFNSENFKPYTIRPQFNFNWHLGLYCSLCFENLNTNVGNNFMISYLQNLLQLSGPDVKKDLRKFIKSLS